MQYGAAIEDEDSSESDEVRFEPRKASKDSSLLRFGAPGVDKGGGRPNVSGGGSTGMPGV